MKSGLTLSISNYDPSQKLASQADREIIIGLYSDDNFLTAGLEPSTPVELLGREAQRSGICTIQQADES